MDWRQELKHNITTAEELRMHIPMSDEEFAAVKQVSSTYPMSIPLYYLALIDKDDPQDPIRKMCVPAALEADSSGRTDTSGETSNTVMNGLQHKYSKTAMVLSTNICAMYCRHCFRKRMVGISDDETAKMLSNISEYIGKTKCIDNVLLSGGDSLLNSNWIIDQMLSDLTAMDHLNLIRFGTRIPVVMPSRIYGDQELLKLLRKHTEKKQLYVVTQFNHPHEFTEESYRAVRALRDCGVVISNQTVLLRGVNDKPETLSGLMNCLTRFGVVPYYVFQCRPVLGVKERFQVPLLSAVDIIEDAKAMLNGHAKRFKYVMSHETGKLEILARLGQDKILLKYHQAKSPDNAGRILTIKLDSDQCWIDEIINQ